MIKLLRKRTRKLETSRRTVVKKHFSKLICRFWKKMLEKDEQKVCGQFFLHFFSNQPLFSKTVEKLTDEEETKMTNIKPTAKTKNSNWVLEFVYNSVFVGNKKIINFQEKIFQRTKLRLRRKWKHFKIESEKLKDDVFPRRMKAFETSWNVETCWNGPQQNWLWTHQHLRIPSWVATALKSSGWSLKSKHRVFVKPKKENGWTSIVKSPTPLRFLLVRCWIESKVVRNFQKKHSLRVEFAVCIFTSTAVFPLFNYCSSIDLEINFSEEMYLVCFTCYWVLRGPEMIAVSCWKGEQSTKSLQIQSPGQQSKRNYSQS